MSTITKSDIKQGEPAAEDINWPCTCCAEHTYLRLRGVPLCAPCGVNLIEARSRQLAKEYDSAAALTFPVDGMKCAKRGHRPSKKSSAAA
jgi:hypothetical protein